MRERGTMVIGTIETAFDGTRWYNQVVGSYMVANYRDTAADAELKGRAMAQARKVHHVVKNHDGEIVSYVNYGGDGRWRAMPVARLSPDIPAEKDAGWQ